VHHLVRYAQILSNCYSKAQCLLDSLDSRPSRWKDRSNNFPAKPQFLK